MQAQSSNHPHEVDVLHQLRELKQNDLMFEYVLSKAIRYLSSPSVGGLPEQAESSHKSYTRALIEHLLTPRELAVVLLASQDLTNKEIAMRLNICAGTVKRHRHNAYEKLHLQGKQSVRQFLRWAYHHLVPQK
jgi:DNA-binding NarL/FixJ family response regulator